MEKARKVLLKIMKYLMKPEMRILPGQLAFFLVMSMIPLLAMIATMAAALSISTDSIRIAISQSIPKEIAELLNGIVQRGGINFNIVIFYFSAFLLASNGTFSMINTSNEIYKVKPRNILSRRIKAIVMIFILMCLFLFLIAVPVFGTTISDIIIQATGDTKAVLLVGKILSILESKWGFLFIILVPNFFLFIYQLYSQKIYKK